MTWTVVLSDGSRHDRSLTRGEGSHGVSQDAEFGAYPSELSRHTQVIVYRDEAGTPTVVVIRDYRK